MDSMRHDGSTKRTDKALRILQQIVKDNKKNERKNAFLSYEKVNDDSDEEEEEEDKEEVSTSQEAAALRLGQKSNLPSVATTAKNSGLLNRDSSVERSATKTESRLLPEMGFKELAKAVQHDSGKKVVISLGLPEDPENRVRKQSKPILYR